MSDKVPAPRWVAARHGQMFSSWELQRSDGLTDEKRERLNEDGDVRYLYYRTRRKMGVDDAYEAALAYQRNMAEQR